MHARINAKNMLREGKPFSSILKFSVPLIIGDFCQQLYNAIDSIIAGRFISTDALAALGSAAPVMNIVVFLLIGFAMGGGVVMSRYYGANEDEKVRHTMSTALAIGLIFTLVLSVASIAFSKPFLRLLNTKESILTDTDNYLKIVFAGAIFTYLYNFYCFAIRAIGDSFTPLMFLFVSVAFNAVLDILFVVVFKWGVEGTAFATVLAQVLSSVLCIIYTNKKYSLLKMTIKDIRIDKKIVMEITSYSLSMSIQQVFVYVGRIAIQGLVNTYPLNSVAGINIGTRLDSLLQTPMRGYVNALTTYTAQNYGAHKYKRVIEGYKASWIFVAVYSVVATAFTVLCAKWMVSLFDDNPEVIVTGTGYTVAIGWGYFLMCLIVQSQGVFKGIGLLKTFVISTFTSIVFRIAFSYLFDYKWGIDGMYWAPTASWVIGGTYCFICMMIAYRKKLLPLAVQESLKDEEDLKSGDLNSEDKEDEAFGYDDLQNSENVNGKEKLWDYSDFKEEEDKSDKL